MNEQARCHGLTLLAGNVPKSFADRVDGHAHIRRNLLERGVQKLLLRDQFLCGLYLLEGCEEILIGRVLDELGMLQDGWLVEHRLRPQHVLKLRDYTEAPYQPSRHVFTCNASYVSVAPAAVPGAPRLRHRSWARCDS